MKKVHLLIGAALALTSAWAVAQDTPESLLPPGFDRPTPKASPTPSAARTSSPSDGDSPRIEAQPVIQTIPDGGSSSTASVAPPSGFKLPSLDQLEKLSPEELAEMMGLKPRFDIPPAARRAMTNIGVLDQDEGGLSATSLAGQNASLVRATLAGNKGAMVSRWGHILLRRALVSRLDAPAGMNPADFTALRAALLVRMGEGEAARALVQDVDTGNFTPDLTQAALDAYVATADFTGICPAVALQGGARKDPQWQVARGICAAYQGDANALQILDRAQYQGVMPKIDMLLAQKYAGAAGKARRAVKIEWDDVSDMTPWRYGLTIAVGLEPPATLMKNAGPSYAYTAATAPMLGLASRAQAADRAAAAGVLSSAAMVDLYGQIYAEDDINEAWSGRADQLRAAYVGATPAARLAAIKQLWDAAPDETQRYSRQVLTAYAAARLPANADLADDAPGLITSMLAAGLDSNAVRWSGIVDEGSLAWGQLMCAAPGVTNQIAAGAISTFKGNDNSEGSRKTAFLLAGLAGLGRVSDATVKDASGDLGIDIHRSSRWSTLIQQAADVDNQTMVALLAGLAMQGDSWDKMTPRYLYNIVSALRKVGLEPEARMIAAEAVARG